MVRGSTAGMIRALALGASMLALACVHLHGGHPHGMPPGQAKMVVPHFHSVACGHVFAEGAWIEIPAGHIHGVGCGHLRVQGGWHSVKVKVR